MSDIELHLAIVLTVTVLVPDAVDDKTYLSLLIDDGVSVSNEFGQDVCCRDVVVDLLLLHHDLLLQP